MRTRQDLGMKTIIFLCFIAISSLGHAELRTDNRELAFVSGYLTSSCYDLYLYSRNKERVSFKDLSDVNSTYFHRKLTIGVVSGMVLGLYNANATSTNVNWNDVVFSGLGGLTSVVIHF